MAEGKKNIWGRLGQKIGDIVLARPTIDDDLLEELEDVLIMSDIGMDTTVKIVDQLREDVRLNYIKDADDVRRRLSEIIAEIVDKGDRHKLSGNMPLVILMIGINGGGKTTTIAKLANMLKAEGKTVLLAAADTFRAAASEQLEIWGERVGVGVITHAAGSDPSAVIFDSIQAAKSRNIDVLICDTAGRLQNKKNLMNEFAKMNRVIDNEFPNAARETLLVVDATTGKNAISQAQEFNNIAEITGLVLTKMDGTAKGGIVITLADECDMAVKFVGIGEKMEDLKAFVPSEFAEGIIYE